MTAFRISVSCAALTLFLLGCGVTVCAMQMIYAGGL
jgi:hypothetical protein